LYNVHNSSSTFSTRTTVLIETSSSEDGAVVSSAVLKSKGINFAVFLGEPDAGTSISVTEDPDGWTLDRNYQFSINGQAYAWQGICRHSIRIPTADRLGVAEETNGEDWKLIRMASSKPQIRRQGAGSVYVPVDGGVVA
jgi:hypothetical protein